MNYFHKIFIFSLILIFVNKTSIEAQDFAPVGTAVAQFLEVGSGARAAGMGFANTAVAEGVDAIAWNPAGLILMQHQTVSFNYNKWPADIAFTNLAAGYRLKRIGVFAFQIYSLQTSPMEITTLIEPEGTGSYFELINRSIGLSYSRFLTNKVAFGITLKNVQEGYLDYTYSTLAVDIGTLYLTAFRELKIGLSIQNFGPDIRFSGNYIDFSDEESYADSVNGKKKFETYSLPMNFRVGISINVMSNQSSNLVFASDMVHSNNNIEDYNFGFEYVFNRQYFIRTGFQSMADEGGLSVGLGALFSLDKVGLAIDYSFSNLGLLSSSHQLSMQLSMK